MKALMVPISDTEQVKKRLVKENCLSNKHKIIVKDKYSFIPINFPVDFGYRILEFDFPNNDKPKFYTDLLDLDKDLLDLVPKSYDVIGSIIIVDIKPEVEKYKEKIGAALLKTHVNVKTILRKADIHGGEFRTQKLTWVAGCKTKKTTYKENNIKLNLDVENVYFSSRLSTERKRIYNQVGKGEKILVMFSGCAPYPVVISKNTDAKEIIGIEKNPIAHNFAKENIKLNKIKNVILYCGDVNDIVPKLSSKFDRILMPLPKDADSFLKLALSVSKKGTIVHFYDFEHDNEIELGEKKVSGACNKNNLKYEILRTVKCGQYGPGRSRICVDFILI